MTPLRILTVDDEPLALRRLSLLMQGVPGADHIGEAAGCGEALSAIAALKPDVVLLDIKMRDGNGFEVVEAVARRPLAPVIIFVTAFDQFAIRAFESSVADYLLKPVDKGRLIRALERARQQIRAQDSEQRVEELQRIVRNLRAARREESETSFETEFWLRSASGQVRIGIDEIDCLSSEDEYVAIHTSAGSHLMRGSLKQFLAKVEPGLFVRAHRRWLVNREAIAEVSARRLGRTEIVLKNGRRLPAGRVYLKQLRQIMRPSKLSSAA